MHEKIYIVYSVSWVDTQIISTHETKEGANKKIEELRQQLKEQEKEFEFSNGEEVSFRFAILPLQD